MSNHIKRTAFLFLSIFGIYFASAVFSYADTVSPVQQTLSSSTVTGSVSTPGQLAGCFDMYHFGSVQVILNTSSTTVDSGTPLSVSASVINQNNYPIVDGAIYVKIFKVPSAAGTNQSQAGDVIDQFYAVQNINLAANAQAAIPFNWQVPAYALTGAYQVVPYFITDGKFNLLGLTFTDDIHGQPLDFNVSGSASGSVMFDKNSVMFDGSPYFFAAFTPKISATSSVPIVATLTNTTGSDVTIPVSADVYSWDAASSVNLLRDIPQTVTIPAHGSTTVSFTITDAVPVTLVVINATYQDTHSILNVRFTRDGIAYPRINFPALSSFPLVSGQPVDLFSCFHAAGSLDTLPGAKVSLTLTDGNGNVVASSTYAGDVTGNMMGMKTTFVPKKNYSKLTLTAETSVGGVIADKAVVDYDCSAIIGASCPPAGVPLIYWIIIIGSLAIIFILAIYFGHRKSKLSHEIAALLIVVILFVGWGGIWKVASASGAGNTQVGLQVPPNGVVWTAQFPVTDNISYGGSSIVMSVAYGGNITNADTSAPIASGSSVPVGTKLSFSPAPFQNENISWFTSGYSWDSPYGYWGNTAPLCSPSDEINGYTGTIDTGRTVSSGRGTAPVIDTFNVYRPMSLSTPNVHIVQNGTAGLTQIGSNEYQVTSPGSILASMVFDPTAATVADEEIVHGYNQVPVQECSGSSGGRGQGSGCTTVEKEVPFSSACTVNNPALFTFAVPQQNIAFTLNVPTPPVASTTIVTIAVVPILNPTSLRDRALSALGFLFNIAHAQTIAPEQAEVFWNVENATACTPTTNPSTGIAWWDPSTFNPSANSFIRPQSGTPNTTANTTTDYTLTCTGLDGQKHSDTARLTIAGTPDPAVSSTTPAGASNPGAPSSGVASSTIPLTNEDINNSLPNAGATTSAPSTPTFHEF